MGYETSRYILHSSLLSLRLGLEDRPEGDNVQVGNKDAFARQCEPDAEIATSSGRVMHAIMMCHNKSNILVIVVSDSGSENEVKNDMENDQ